jgi:hypothetical protein
MMNLVIAILTKVYENMIVLQNGLYFDDIIEILPEMDWHD